MKPFPIELQPNERYAGVLLDLNGEIRHHLVLLPEEAVGVTWQQATEWATKAGGELPTRREQALLFANLPSHFQLRWYWSSDTHEADDGCAWFQYFDDGYQNYHSKSYEGRARAVRRVTPSVF